MADNMNLHNRHSSMILRYVGHEFCRLIEHRTLDFTVHCHRRKVVWFYDAAGVLYPLGDGRFRLSEKGTPDLCGIKYVIGDCVGLR